MAERANDIQLNKRQNKQYILDKVDPYINRMMLEIINEKPTNVMKFMSEWIYKEQNPDFIKKALEDLHLTYGKVDNGSDSEGQSENGSRANQSFVPSMNKTPRSSKENSVDIGRSDSEGFGRLDGFRSASNPAVKVIENDIAGLTSPIAYRSVQDNTSQDYFAKEAFHTEGLPSRLRSEIIEEKDPNEESNENNENEHLKANDVSQDNLHRRTLLLQNPKTLLEIPTEKA